MDLKRLNELRTKLANDKDLAPVWTFFMDHFAEDAGFIELGKVTRHSFVESVVAEVGSQMFPGDSSLVGLMLSPVPQTDFIHGVFMMGGRVGGVIYFEDSFVGLVSVCEHPGSIMVKYAHFSGRLVRPRGRRRKLTQPPKILVHRHSCIGG